MGNVVQFIPKQTIPTAPLLYQSTTIYEKGGGPSFDPGAFSVFLDRARRKRNACLQLRSLGSGDESSGRTAVSYRGQMGEEREVPVAGTPMLKKSRSGSTPEAPTKCLSSQPLTPIRPGAASRISVPAQPTETP
jgi:hypothetical protein